MPPSILSLNYASWNVTFVKVLAPPSVFLDILLVGWFTRMIYLSLYSSVPMKWNRFVHEKCFDICGSSRRRAWNTQGNGERGNEWRIRRLEETSFCFTLQASHASVFVFPAQRSPQHAQGCGVPTWWLIIQASIIDLWCKTSEWSDVLLH